MDRLETAPPSAPAASDTPAPPQRRRYITLPPLPPAPAPAAHPVCRSACSRSVGLSGPDRDRLQPETPPTIWSSRWGHTDSTDALRPLTTHWQASGGEPLLQSIFSVEVGAQPASSN